MKLTEERFNEICTGCKFTGWADRDHPGTLKCEHDHNVCGICIHEACPLIKHEARPSYKVPSVPGYYWMKFHDSKGLDRFSWSIKHVFMDDRDNLCITVPNPNKLGGIFYREVTTLKADWYGPIPLPPKEDSK